MRYGWKIDGTPTHCACGETNMDQLHMQTGQIYIINEVQVSERL